MTGKSKKSSASWSDVKAKLATFDRAGLLRLVQDLYAASKDNQTFLHARFALGDDALKPYKTTLDRWLWPDVFKNQDISVAKAKKAVADYRKAIGLQDEGYFNALVRMFDQALKAINTLPETQRAALLTRLDTVRRISQNFGYGVGDDMDALLVEYGVDG